MGLIGFWNIVQIETTENWFVIVTPSIGVGTNTLMMVTMIMLKCVVIIDQFEKKK